MHNIPSSIFPCSHRQTCHLGGNADPPFVQEPDSDLISTAFLTKQIFLWNLHIIEVQHARATRLDAELLLFLSDRETWGSLLDDESRDAFVTLAGI
jgi:hypothetical protein